MQNFPDDRFGFSKEDREEHNLRVARLAKILSKQSNIVVSVIAPFRTTREKITAIIPDVKWIYIKRSGLDKPDRPYEPPVNVPVVEIDGNNKSECFRNLWRAIYD